MAAANVHNRGRMNDIDYDVIQSNIVYLKEQLRGNDIAENMFQRKIINRDEMDKIEKEQEKGRPEGVRALLKCLMETGGVNAFGEFIDCLNNSGFEHVAEKLKLDRKGRTDAMNVEAKLPDPEHTTPTPPYNS
ncbi:hypothetical protein SNE40_020316 [Patella caerulea]|uniref:CARD domain-containing protein n=1 Tax=Patella caerulea TaxID=87958 RepID=A0AAN8GAE7_PATCE